MFRAELRVASLKGASLRNCDLRRATLAGADLEVSAQPTHAILRTFAEL
jgi:uncharacterized protein YjbI with pentapeptide repeats